MKFQRQAKILEIIEKNDIETQEELSAHLRAIGFETTQATVSRDIKELRLIKVLAPGGKYKYATSSKNSSNSFTTRLRNIFKECVISIDHAQNIVVIKTLPGLGSAAAGAIDAMKAGDIVGTLAGDDTVFIVIHDSAMAEDFCAEAEKMLK